MEAVAIHMEATVELLCLFVGVGAMASVVVPFDAHITDVKRSIKHAFPVLIPCDASQLKLFLAVQDDKWLTVDSHATASLGTITGFPLMDCVRVSDVAEWPQGASVVHLLVSLPDPPKLTQLTQLARNWMRCVAVGEMLLTIAVFVTTLVLAAMVIVHEPSDDSSSDDSDEQFAFFCTCNTVVAIAFLLSLAAGSIKAWFRDRAAF